MKEVPRKVFFDFGEFRLDAEKQRLLREGEIVPIAPKAVEMLTLLIQQRGRLVEREDLMNAVWPATAVEPGNLDVTISKLRKALGEDGNGRKFIETVPRLGYKFVAEVREVVDRVPVLLIEKHTAGRIVIDEQIGIDRLKVPLQSSRLLSTSRARLLTFGMVAAATVLTVLAVTWFWNPKSNETGPQIRSIAILPLKPLTQNSADDALSQGFADALMTSLGRVNGVRVLSATAVSRNADLQNEPLKIGRQLGVDTVLDGTLQRANGKLRVTLRMIRTSDGQQIWSGSFDDAESEIFKLEDAMAAQTAQSLRWNLAANQQPNARRYTENREAYESYLRGRFFFDKRTPENYDKAIGEFDKAIALDPNYALAYTGLADVYALQANTRHGADRDELYEKSRERAAKALQLDEALAEAHTSLGWIKRVHDWDWRGSEREFQRALELNDKQVNARQWYALLLMSLGRSDEALSQIEKARELDPLSTVVLLNCFAVRQYRRDNDQLPILAQQITSLDGSESTKNRLFSAAYSRAGDHLKVIELGEAYLANHNSKDIPVYLATHLALAYTSVNRADKAKAMIDYLSQRAVTDTEVAYRLASYYAEAGKKDLAITLLQNCFSGHDDRLVWLKVEPAFDSLRTDARFQDLLRKMNL